MVSLFILKTGKERKMEKMVCQKSFGVAEAKYNKNFAWLQKHASKKQRRQRHLSQQFLTKWVNSGYDPLDFVENYCVSRPNNRDVI